MTTPNAEEGAPPFPSPSLLAKWSADLKRIRCEQLLPLESSRKKWAQLVDVTQPYAGLADIGGFFQWLAQGHVTISATAIRRACDAHAKSTNLMSLSLSLQENAESLTRAWFNSRYPRHLADRGFADRDFNSISGDAEAIAVSKNVFSADRKLLQEASKRVRVFTTQWIAHTDKDQATGSVAFADIDRASVMMEEVYKKYHLLIEATQATLVVEDWYVNIRDKLLRIWPDPKTAVLPLDDFGHEGHDA